MKQGRIIIADKHMNVLGAIRDLLETETETVLMVADEVSFWAALEHFQPDMVVADLSLPFRQGIRAGRLLKNKYPSVKVIMLTQYDEKTVVDEVLATGVAGLISKRRAAIDLIPALCEIRQGRTFVSQDIRGEE